MAYDEMPDQIDRNDIYDAEVEQPQEGGSGVKDALLGLAKFAIGMAVLGKASQLGAGALYKNVVTKNAALAAGVEGIVGKEAIAKGSLNMGGLFRGVRQTLAENPTSVYGMTSQSGTKMMEVLSSASRGSIVAGKSMSGMYSRWAGAKSFGMRATAGIAKQLYKSAPVAAGWYGVSRTLGLEKNENQPAWYNVPGHIGEVAKMTAEFAAFDTGLGGLKKLGGFAKNIASKQFSQEASPGLHAYMDKRFAITRNIDGSTKAGSFLEKAVRVGAVLDGLREGGKTLSGHIMKTLGNSFGNAAERNAQRSSLFDFTNRAYHRQVKNDTVQAFNTAYRSRMNSLHNYRGDYAHDGLKSINAMIAKDIKVDEGWLAEHTRERNYKGSYLERAADNGIGHGIFSGVDRTMGKAMRAQFQRQTLREANSMGASILHRQTASVADIMTGADRRQLDHQFSYLQDAASDATAGIDKIKDGFMKMSAGPNIYKSGTGVVDYSMWSPKNMLSTLTHYVNPYFIVGAFGRELPLVKTLGFQKFLTGEGLGIHSIRANEGHRYFDRGRGETRTVGDEITKIDDKSLGGMVIDGELFTMSAEGIMRKADAARQRMVYSTPYARDSVLNKLNAEAATSGSDIGNIIKLQEEHKKSGFADRINNFASRWGLQLPSPINWVAEKLGQSFGFGAQKAGVDQAINLLMDPRNTVKSVGGDASAVIGMFGDLGNDASKSLYKTLSQPKALDIIARLGKDIGGDAHDRVAALKTALGGTDEEVMSYIRNNQAFSNDDQLKYALEHYGHFKSYGLNEQMSAKFSFRDVPLTKRQEINRVLLNKTLGMQGLPQTDAAYSVENIARRMSEDSEVLSTFSKEEVKHLKTLGTQIDLFKFGYLDGTGRVAANYGEVAKKDALEIIRDRFKNDTHYLQTKLYDTHAIKSMSVLGFGRSSNDVDPFLTTYSRKLGAAHHETMSASPFMMREEGGGLGLKVNSILDRVMGMGNHIGLKYGMEDRKPYTFKIPELFNKPVFGKQLIQPGKGVTLGGPMTNIMKRIAQGVGVMAAAQAIDTFTDVNPMFNGTMLDNGVFSAAADVYVKGSMAYHKIQDLTGITEAGKYLEGLMPSSTSTIPGAIVGGFLKGPLGILPGAVINRFMGANGILPNFDKSYEDMKGTYSGRDLVPVRRNRFWLFSKAPYEGDGPQYFRPHWYPRLKSQYKYTDTLYGSKAEAFIFAPWTGLGFNPIGHVIDKYHYEKKHYWDRPYPVSAPAFSEVPVIGKLLSATIGRLPIIGKPLKYMHQDEMSHYYSTGDSNTSSDGQFSTSNMPKVTQMEQTLYMNKGTGGTAETALRGGNLKAMNPYGTMTVLGEQLYDFTELAGLRGYQLETMMGGGLADEHPRLSNASDMWSARRAFWDLSAGDIFGSCFVKGTRVVTTTGRKKIEDIEIGEQIITLDGTIRQVIGKLKKEQQSNIYELRCSTVNVIIKVTEKHHFPIYKRYSCHEQNTRPCMPGNKKHCSICTKSNKNITLEDIPIEEIKRGDFVCLPIIQSILDEQYINNISIDSDIAYFLGWYVAEGYSEKYRISLSMNSNEIEYANKLKVIIETKFHNNVSIKIKGSSLRLSFSNKKLAAELKLLLGHRAKNKFIPYKIKILPKEILSSFFKGCVLGDGFSNKKLAGFTSCSSDLCRDLYDIGLSLGFVGHLVIDYYENGRGIMPQGTLRKDSIRSYISWKSSALAIYNLLYNANEIILPKKKNGKSFIYNNMLFVQVSFVSKIEFTEDVYDLEIEDKHYYMVEHILTHNTEFFRRFVPRDKKIWQKVNPIRNKMSSWLPSQEGDYFQDFLTGDPYTKIPEGEMRLPGDAYNRLYDVKRQFPARASGFGDTVMDQVRSMTGLESPSNNDEEDIMESGTQIHKYIQETMLRANVGYKAEALVYDAKNDISGHIDLLMYDPYRKGGKRPLEIKTVSGKKFNKIKAPIPHHVSQINFYLRQMQMDVGTLLYINRDDPTQIRTFDVRYNEEHFRKDLLDLQKARKIAAGIMTDGKGYETGTSYSWLDRFRILADVAPYSKEFKDAAQIIKLQMKENKLTEADKEEVAKINQRRKAVMRKFDLYPTRFRGRVFNPDTTYELWSENTNIKAAANYSFAERVAGAAWERGIQMDTPLNTKLWNYKSPLQHYRSTKIYGTEAASWNRPYQDFLKPMATKAMSTDNPVDAAAAFGWIGAMGFGGMGNMAIPGAVFGGMFGAAKTVVGDDGWIPDEVNKKREIERNFDQLKYQKAMYMYENTGDERYKTEADNTLWNIRNTGYDVGVGQAMKSLSPFEKPYFLSWIKETNPIEREKILEMVPDDVGNLLKSNWGMSHDLPQPSKYNAMVPNADWEGMMPDNNLDDIQLKTIEQAGLRANDFGLGWYDQQRRVAASQFELNPVKDPSQVMSSNNGAAQVKAALMRSLTKFTNRPLISVSVNPSGEDCVKVNLNLMRNRYNDIKDALRSR